MVEEIVRDDDLEGRMTVEEIRAETDGVKALLAPLMRRNSPSRKDRVIIAHGRAVLLILRAELSKLEPDA